MHHSAAGNSRDHLPVPQTSSSSSQSCRRGNPAALPGSPLANPAQTTPPTSARPTTARPASSGHTPSGRRRDPAAPQRPALLPTPALPPGLTPLPAPPVAPGRLVRLNSEELRGDGGDDQRPVQQADGESSSERCSVTACSIAIPKVAIATKRQQTSCDVIHRRFPASFSSENHGRGLERQERTQTSLDRGA